MAYRVRDEIEISIRINGLEYPLGEVNTLNFLHMACGTRLKLPSMHFSIVDVTGSMPKMGLADGVPVQIVVSNSGIAVARNFLVNSWINPPSSQMYNIDGFWAAPKFRIGTKSGSIVGTSDYALSEIARLCGLQYSGIQTNDQQAWIPRNKTYADFAAYISKCGYVDDQSHLVCAVDSLGVLRYRNARRPNEVYSVVHGYHAERAFQAKDFQPETTSGFNSAFGASRSTRIIQTVMGTNGRLDQLAFTPNSRKLLVNQGVRAAQERGSFSYAPIDFGNVNPNRQKAEYQNSRFNSLLSAGGKFLMTVPTELEPLDGINFSTSVKAPGDYDGRYVLGHKVIYVQGNTYVEKFNGYKEGLA